MLLFWYSFAGFTLLHQMVFGLFQIKNMEYWKLTRLEFLNIRILLYYLVSIAIIFITLFAILATITRSFPSEPRSPLTGKAGFHVQTFGQKKGALENIPLLAGGRKLLGGPGSSPPRCITKCGQCTPCRPVHVPVPPGTPVTTEYYPEAWRCKCGNKLYMP